MMNKSPNYKHGQKSLGGGRGAEIVNHVDSPRLHPPRKHPRNTRGNVFRGKAARHVSCLSVCPLVCFISHRYRKKKLQVQTRGKSGRELRFGLRRNHEAYINIIQLMVKNGHAKSTFLAEIQN